MIQSYGYTINDIDDDEVSVTVNGEFSTAECVVIEIDSETEDDGMYTELTPDQAIGFARALLNAAGFARMNAESE